MAYQIRRLPDAPWLGRDGHAQLPEAFGTPALFVLGGWNDAFGNEAQDYFHAQRTNDIWGCQSFGDLEDGRWRRQTRGAQWAPRHTFGCARSGSVVHVFGADAQVGYYLKDHWIGGGPLSWRRQFPTNAGAAMPMSDRILMIPAELPNGDVLMIGGQTYPPAIGPLDPFLVVELRTDIWRYSPATLEWTEVIAECPALPRCAVQKAVVHAVEEVDYLYLFGGGDYDMTVMNAEVWRCPVDALDDPEAWEMLTADAGWEPRIYTSIESWQGKLWLIAGRDATNKGDIWVSEDDGYTWTDTGLSIPVRHAHATCVWNDRIIITGGSGANDRKRDIYVIEAV